MFDYERQKLIVRQKVRRWLRQANGGWGVTVSVSAFVEDMEVLGLTCWTPFRQATLRSERRLVIGYASTGEPLAVVPIFAGVINFSTTRAVIEYVLSVVGPDQIETEY